MPSRLPKRLTKRGLGLLAMLVALAAIFVADTLSRYEVAAAVFYILVILSASSALGRRSLTLLAATCVVLTLASFGMSIWFDTQGAYRSGLINSAISIVAIVVTAWLALKRAAAAQAARQAQTQFLRLARVHSLQNLTASIAHEVNQPLAAIATSADAAQRWLTREPPHRDAARQSLARIQQDAARASAVIERVRCLTRGATPQARPFAVNAALREVLALSQETLRRARIQLHTALDASEPQVLADRVQIQQVLSNLVLNAIEAMVTSACKQRLLQLASHAGDDHVVLTLSDSGPGLSTEARTHLFEAFWTSKADGIGIGLSISRAIVESYGGRIWVDDTPIKPGINLKTRSQTNHQANNIPGESGKIYGGARFCIRLPRADSPAA